MTDKEIIRALECCRDLKCSECPKKTNLFVTDCDVKLCDEVLDLIKRQQAEKEALIAGQETLQKYIAEKNVIIEELEKAKSKRFEENRKIIRHNSALIDEIHELQAEIESLESRIFALNETNKILMETQKVYTNNKLKEFAEEFEKRCIASGIYPAVTKNILKNLVKELTEVKDDENSEIY